MQPLLASCCDFEVLNILGNHSSDAFASLPGFWPYMALSSGISLFLWVIHKLYTSMFEIKWYHIESIFAFNTKLIMLIGILVTYACNHTC